MADAPALALDLEEELKSLRRVVEAFMDYPAAAEGVVLRWEQSYGWLSPKHKALLPHLPAKYAEARRCIRANADFISEMLQAFEPPFELPPSASHIDNTRHHWHTEPHTGMHACKHAHHQGCHPLNPMSPLPTDQGHGPPQEFPAGQPSGSVTLQSSRGQEALGPGQAHNGAAVTAGTGDIGSVQSPNSGAGRNVGPCDGASMGPQEVAERDTSGSGPNSHRGSLGEQLPLWASVAPPPWLAVDRSRAVPPADADKVRCILRSVIREWTAEGQQERDEAFAPILRELRRKFHHRLAFPCKDAAQDAPRLEEAAERAAQTGGEARRAADGTAVRGPAACLVPGAGLGRLCLEVCKMGMSCQGNEHSFYTLVASSFLLNCCSGAGQWTLYPWVLSSCNSRSDTDQLRPVSVPDELPSVPQPEPGEGTQFVDFSMCAGDFVEVYSQPSQAGAWDSVATCFFLDTSHNVVEYLEVIYHILCPGGVWINLGPLLYHFADQTGSSLYGSSEERRRMEMSLELSLDDVRRIALGLGFRLEKEEFVKTTYSANSVSMMHTAYNCVLWTMVKE